MTHYIYIVRNLVNGKFYIGKHCGEIEDNYLGSGKLIKSAILKYGKENFKKEILEICEEKSLDNAEIKWINFFGGVGSNNIYNISEGGTGGNVMKHLPIKIVSETRSGWFQKLSEDKKLQIRKDRSERAKKLNSNSEFIEIRTKTLLKTLENKTTEEIFKTYENRRGKNHKKSRKIITPFGEFESMGLAAKILNINVQTILNRCKNVKFTEWRFIDES